MEENKTLIVIVAVVAIAAVVALVASNREKPFVQTSNDPVVLVPENIHGQATAPLCPCPSTYHSPQVGAGYYDLLKGDCGRACLTGTCTYYRTREEEINVLYRTKISVPCATLYAIEP